MKGVYLGAGLAGLAMLVVRAKKRDRAQQTMSEGVDFSHASDWQGSISDRLSGRDLLLSYAPNYGGSIGNAAPSRYELNAVAPVAGWNGALS